MKLGDITSYEMVEALTPDTRIQLLEKRILLFENFFVKHAVNMLLQSGDNEQQQTVCFILNNSLTAHWRQFFVKNDVCKMTVVHRVHMLIRIS